MTRARVRPLALRIVRITAPGDAGHEDLVHVEASRHPSAGRTARRSIPYELHRCAVCAAATIFQRSGWTDMSQLDVSHHAIPRLVLRVAPGPRQAARLLDLADEVLCLADEVILDAGDFPDDCLERIAAFVGAASAQGNVKVCGLRGSQVRQLFRLGI